MKKKEQEKYKKIIKRKLPNEIKRRKQLIYKIQKIDI